MTAYLCDLILLTSIHIFVHRIHSILSNENRESTVDRVSESHAKVWRYGRVSFQCEVNAIKVAFLFHLKDPVQLIDFRLPRP